MLLVALNTWNEQVCFCRWHRIFSLKCALLWDINTHGMMLNGGTYEMKYQLFKLSGIGGPWPPGPPLATPLTVDSVVDVVV